MPTSSFEQRARWWRDVCGTYTAEKYLKERGYQLHSSWTWILPTPDHLPTEDEIDAMEYLQDEWDYGGYVADEIMLPPEPIEDKEKGPAD